MEIKLRVAACDTLHKYAKQKNIYAKILAFCRALCHNRLYSITLLPGFARLRIPIDRRKTP